MFQRIALGNSKMWSTVEHTCYISIEETNPEEFEFKASLGYTTRSYFNTHPIYSLTTKDSKEILTKHIFDEVLRSE